MPLFRYDFGRVLSDLRAETEISRGQSRVSVFDPGVGGQRPLQEPLAFAPFLPIERCDRLPVGPYDDCQTNLTLVSMQHLPRMHASLEQTPAVAHVRPRLLHARQVVSFAPGAGQRALSSVLDAPVALEDGYKY